MHMRSSHKILANWYHKWTARIAKHAKSRKVSYLTKTSSKSSSATVDAVSDDSTSPTRLKLWHKQTTEFHNVSTWSWRCQWNRICILSRHWGACELDWAGQDVSPWIAEIGQTWPLRLLLLTERQPVIQLTVLTVCWHVFCLNLQQDQSIRLDYRRSRKERTSGSLFFL